MRPTVLAVVSDLHCGSSTALCPPTVTLDDGGVYAASKAQRWLWESWLVFWRRAASLCKQHNARLIFVHNGDLTEGEHHGTTQILSGNPTAQADVVNAAMKAPLALKPGALFFLRGTAAHVGKSACYEERVADGLMRDGRPVVGDPETGTASWWHLKMEIEGVRLDFAHHGRMGQRPHTRGSIANLLAFQIYTEHCLRGEPPPHIAVRSHMHQYWDTANAYPTRLIQTASFQLATEYVHRIVPESALADIGGVLLLIKHGTLTVEPVLARPASPTPWRPA